MTRKSDENSGGKHFILMNPNDVDDYVAFDFAFVKKAVGVEYIDSIFFDGTGFYVLVTESIKTETMKLFYVSPAGIEPIAADLFCRNWAFSGFIKSADTLFLKLEQSLYEIDDRTKAFRKVKDFGANRVSAYPYQNGIVYQSDDEVRFYSEAGDMILFHLPDDARFAGWYDVGKSAFVEMPHRETYLLDLETGTLNLFSKFSYDNLGNCANGVLLMMWPKGGGGATPLDVDYTWSYLLGNDVLMAFTNSIYNKETGRIQNIYFADSSVTSAWLDMPYDKNRFEEIKQELKEQGLLP